MELRDATMEDAGQIAGIYNYYVEHTAISFEEQAVAEADMKERIAQVRKAQLPWIVAVVDGQVVAYAYATPWRVRPAYRFSVESSVYVRSGCAAQGLGSALYTALLARLRESGLHLVIGGIALPNEASVALHEKMGYQKAAHFSEVGRKFGRWIDVGYWELRL